MSRRIHTIHIWGKGEDANGRYWDTDAGTRVFEDQYVYWDGSEQWGSVSNGVSPHRWWVCAYNDVGIGELSEAVEFSATPERTAPSNTDEEVPEAPVNVKAELVYDELSLTASNNYIRLTWELPEIGAGIDSFTVTVDDGSGSEPEIRKVAVQGERRIRKDLPYSEHYEKMYTFTVTAENTAGASPARTAQVYATAVPNLEVHASGSHSALLTWTNLVCDEFRSIENFRIMRRSAYSLWEKVHEEPGLEDKPYGQYSCEDTGLETGVPYEYRVEAVDGDGRVHTSSVKTVTATVRDERAETPADFSAKAVNGDVILSWTPATEGGLPTGYKLMYQPTDQDPETGSWGILDLSYQAFGNSDCAVISWTEIMPGGGYSELELAGNEYRMRLCACIKGGEDSEPGNMIVFTWPSEGNTDGEPPKPITPEAEAGDGQVTLRWNARTEAEREENEPAAAYYQIVKTWEAEYGTMGVTVTLDGGRTSYEWVDTDVENGVAYNYELQPCSSFVAMDEYGNEYLYSPLCYMHAVTVTPIGKTASERTAEAIAAIAAELPDDPAELTSAQKDIVRQLKERYEKLTPQEKKFLLEDVAAKVERLIAAVEAEEIREKYEADERIMAVTGRINALPEASLVTEADAPDIQEARALYDALPSDAKSLIENLSRLRESAVVALITPRAATFPPAVS